MRHAEILRRGGRIDEARQILDGLLARMPRNPGALLARANLAFHTGDLAGALRYCSRLVEEDPASAAGWSNIGMILRGQGRDADAREAYRRALEADPCHSSALLNLSNVLAAEGDGEGAEDLLRRLVAGHPDHAEGWNNLGIHLWRQGRLDEAETMMRRALALLGGADAQTCYNLALLLLTVGRYEEGFAAYEARWDAPGFPAPRRYRDRPAWDGTPAGGATVLVHAEQGMGDCLQFVRYVPQVKAQGARVVVEAPRALHPLLATCPGIDALIAHGDSAPDFDFQVPMMSLAHRLGTRLDTVPASVPYLTAPAERVAHWRRRFAEDGRLAVGLAWAGNPDNPADAVRSIPTEVLAPLARLKGVRLYSIQVGAAAGEAARIDGPDAVVDLSADIGPWEEMAAAIAAFDLTISACSAPAHLAGALGVPLWVLLAHVPDWRWLMDRGDSPWYPTARLFRQPQPGDWASVVAAAAGALERRVSG